MNINPYHFLQNLFIHAIEAVDPQSCVRRHIQLEGNQFKLRTPQSETVFDLRRFSKIFVIGAGKATLPMAQALEEVLGNRISDGVISVKYGSQGSLRRIRKYEAGHPLPDTNSVTAAQKILDLLEQADRQTLVINLISGGGSALLCAPWQGNVNGQFIEIQLAEIIEVTQSLLHSGASIQEMNCIRKHLSRIKGGRLAEAIFPGTGISLLLSDVIGNSLDAIASGPTVPDTTSYQEAWQILQKYQLMDRISPNVKTVLQQGAAGSILETPRAHSILFDSMHNTVIGDNRMALQAAKTQAIQLGFPTQIISNQLIGDCHKAAQFLAQTAFHMTMVRKPPFCLLAGGETTVQVTGNGKGGRNQEMALGFLGELERICNQPSGIYFLSTSTDGNDGPTDAAGAWASCEVLQAARQAGLNWLEYQKNNDSYHFFDKIDFLFKTGLTQTNVCDLQMILVQ